MALRTIEFKNHRFDIAYDIINPQNKKDLIILHGWGSSKEFMKQAFSDKLKEFRLIFVDLPGFGKSSNDTVLTTRDYRDILKLFISDLKLNRYAVMGHSFGGKVATLLEPDNLILLSSAGIVTKKSLKVRFKIQLFKLLKPLGIKKLRRIFASDDVKGMSQNMYETFKNVVDEDFSKEFENYRGKALIFWGEDDTATPLESGEKISSLIKDSKFFPLSGDHFFFIKNSYFIDKIVSKELK